MYSPKTWKNDKSGKTPILAEDLNHMENGIANAVETDSVARVSNVVSKNLFNFSSYNKYNNNAEYTYENNTITVKSTGGWGFTQLENIKLVVGQEYTFSTYFLNNQSINNGVIIYNSNDQTLNYQTSSDTSGRFTITFTPDTETVKIKLASNNTSDSHDNKVIYSDIQLDEGSTATSYVPYLNLEEVQEKLLMEPINISFNEEYVYSSDLNYICFKIGNIVFLNIHAIAFKKDIPHGAIIISNLPKAASDIIAYLYGGLNAKGDTSRVTINTNGNMNIHYGSPLYYGDSASNQYSTTIIYKTTD